MMQPSAALTMREFAAEDPSEGFGFLEDSALHPYRHGGLGALEACRPGLGNRARISTTQRVQQTYSVG